MQGFRKAFARARQYDPNASHNRGQHFDPDWNYETGDAPLPSNHWRTVNYTVIEDKPVLSASGILPIVERQPVAASSEAVMSIDLFGQLEYGKDEDLPRVEFEINNRRYSFTTAAFREYTEHSEMRMKEDVEDWDGSGPSWYWKTVSSADTGDAVDVDGDNKEEYVLEKDGSALKVLDYQEGEVDLSIEDGVLQGYDKTQLVENSTFQRQENASGITATDKINARETFVRTIQTKDGDYYVEDNFVDHTSKAWFTPHE